MKFMHVGDTHIGQVYKNDTRNNDIKYAFTQMIKLYREKKIHPLDLKNAVAENLIKRFKNAREYFERQTDLLQELGESFMPY